MKASKPSKAPPTIPTGLLPWHYALAVLAALIGLFVVYGPSMSGPFLLDDSYLPYQLSSYEHKTLSEWMKGVRPILMLSYWLNFRASGDETFGYHFVNVLLHFLNGAWVFLIVRRVLDWARFEKWDRNVFALFAAGLFLFHPLQTESVSYIASRSETLSVFFFLAAFALFVYRRAAGASWVISAGVLVLFGAACLVKEHSAVLPALLLLTDYYWNPGFTLQGIRRNWRLYVPILLGGAVAVMFVLRLLSSSTSAGFGMKDLTWYQYFFTQCRAIWHYVLFFFVPLGQNLDHDYPISTTILHHGALLGLLCLVALIAAAWHYGQRHPLVSYGVFTLLLLFAPTSSIVPIRDTLVERRMYLPFIGFLFVAIGMLRWWKTSRTALVTTLGVILLAEAGLTYSRNELWSNAVSIWADSVSKSPGKVRPRFQLAYAYYAAGRCPEAVNEFARTGELETPDFSLLVDWALASDCAGNSSDALAKLQQAAALNGTAHVYSQIGMEYAKLKQYPQSLDALEKAQKLDPSFAMTYIYRGNVYSLQGKRRDAAAEYQRVLEMDPQNQVARDGMIRLSQQ